jgi:hypothetical protein
MSLDAFEQSLLTELREHVARSSVRATPRRRWTVGVAAGALAAGAVAVAVGIVSNVAGASPAYAVESAPNGDILVTVHELSNTNGLKHALATKGINARITYVPGFSQAGGQERTTSGEVGTACTIELAKIDGGLRFTLDASAIASGAELNIVTSGSEPTDVGSPVEVDWSGGECGHSS